MSFPADLPDEIDTLGDISDEYRLGLGERREELRNRCWNDCQKNIFSGRGGKQHVQREIYSKERETANRQRSPNS